MTFTQESVRNQPLRRSRHSMGSLLKSATFYGSLMAGVGATVFGVPQYMAKQESRFEAMRQEIAASPSERVSVDGTLSEMLAERGFHQGTMEYKVMLADTICRNTKHVVGNVDAIVAACNAGGAVPVPLMRPAHYAVASVELKDQKSY